MQMVIFKGKKEILKVPIEEERMVRNFILSYINYWNGDCSDIVNFSLETDEAIRRYKRVR